MLEVVIASGGVNKVEGYRRMGIPEVWFWEDGVLKVYHLNADGSAYAPTPQSQLLPDLPLDLLCRYVTYYDQFDAVDEFLTAIQN